MGLGPVAGILTGGRLAKRAVRRGRLTARLAVAGGGYLAAAALFLPGMFSRTLIISVPAFMIAGRPWLPPIPPSTLPGWT